MKSISCLRDKTGISYNIDLWHELLRVLKPGAHLLAFGGTRTYHRMACAVEDSGFEIRDMVHRLSKDNVLKLVREFFLYRK